MIYTPVPLALRTVLRVGGAMNTHMILEAPVASAEDATRRQAAWHPVCAVSELEPMWGEAALIGETQIALITLIDGRIFAVDHRDPVAGANVMARGIVGSQQGRPTLASPLYKQVYDLATGRCLTEDGPALRCYPVRVDDGIVQVQV